MTSPDPSPTPPIPVVAESSRPRSRRRRSRSGSPARGRIYLILFWLLLNGYNVFVYWTTPDYDRRALLRHEAPLFVVLTSLFAGILCRQNWSRYLLISFLLYRAGATLIFVPNRTEEMLQSLEVAFDVLLAPVLLSLVIWGLIAIPSIRRLVSRTYE